MAQKVYIGGFSVLIFTLLYYQTIRGNYYSERAKNNYVRLVPLSAIRGTIFDRRGIPIAYDKAAFNISVIPHQIKKRKDKLFNEISKFLNITTASMHKNYKRNLRSFFTPVNIIQNIEKARALKLKGKFEDSILINPQPQRYYPYPYQFAHLLGYVKKAAALYEKLKKYGYTPLERVGFLGIEQYYDTYLRGEDGGDLIEVNAKDKIVGFLGTLTPKKGKNIYLSIDKQIQEIAANLMQEKRGTVILMNSYTGEIIALYSSPSFNTNHFIKGKNIDKYLHDKESPLLNRALQSAYPVGSTFKPILALAALQENKIVPSKTFTCTGELDLGAAEFGCWDTHGTKDLYGALARSCNIYFYNLGMMLGPNIISKWAKKFGLDSYTDIDLPYEKKGFIPTPKWKQNRLRTGWFQGDTLNLSIGQGFMSSTPLEIMVAINVFANGGYLITPTILKKVDSINSEISTKTYLGITSKYLDIVKKGIRRTVTDMYGTAHTLKNLNLKISGKTGTAQTRGESHGWFIGFFPYKETGYTICAFLENAGSSHEAVKLVYYFLKKIKEEGLL